MLSNNSYNHFIQALKYCLYEKFDNNISALAQAAGYSRVYISNIINGVKSASYEAQAQIAYTFGYDLTDFLIFGKSLSDGESVKIVNQPVSDRFIYIPKVEATLSAGAGSFETNDNEISSYSFQEDWIRGVGRPNDLVLMEVSGDSMSPLIMDKDTIMIDTSKTNLLPHKIYAVRVEDLIYLKYIDREPGKFILNSHNPNYNPIIIETAFLNEHSFAILGQVVWWGHTA